MFHDDMAGLWYTRFTCILSSLHLWHYIVRSKFHFHQHRGRTCSSLYQTFFGMGQTTNQPVVGLTLV